MKPASLSASAIQNYEHCPAMYLASSILKAPEISGSAASLGTACHAALEGYVKTGVYLKPDLEALLEMFRHEYHLLFATDARLEEGLDILRNWWARTDLLDGRKILSTEEKVSFPLPTSAGEIPFNYIWDRCDELPDGIIEVIDYKTYIKPVQPEEMRKLLQPRLYGLAAAIKYPDASAWWVVYDLLRYDAVGVRFTREDNIETWNYLKAVAERILADDGTAENLNPNCRWCVRGPVCQTLTAHVKVGGILSMSDPDLAINKRAQLEYARAGIEANITALDELILNWAESEELLEFKTETTQMNITARQVRELDNNRAAKILGPDIMSKYGNLKMSNVDALMKGTEITAAQKVELKGLIGRKFNAPSVKTKPVAPLGEDD